MIDLGRNYDEILEQWQSITKKKKVNITVLDFPLLNTKNSDDNITGKLISDIVLQVLSYVAQFEREQIKQRQMEGIPRSKEKREKNSGRPKLLAPDNLPDVIAQYTKKEITLREGSRHL